MAAPLTLLLASCKSVEAPKVPGVTPYRMVIQQGNFISQEMVSQLKPGMSKEQVRFVLGTPLVNDIFHADRWDYVFFRELPSGKREQRNLSVMFEKDKLARVLGDLMPPDSATPAASGFDSQAKPAAKPAAEGLACGRSAQAGCGVAKPLPSRRRPRPTGKRPSKIGALPSTNRRRSEARAGCRAKKRRSPKRTQRRGFFGRMLEE